MGFLFDIRRKPFLSYFSTPLCVDAKMRTDAAEAASAYSDNQRKLHPGCQYRRSRLLLPTEFKRGSGRISQLPTGRRRTAWVNFFIVQAFLFGSIPSTIAFYTLHNHHQWPHNGKGFSQPQNRISPTAKQKRPFTSARKMVLTTPESIIEQASTEKLLDILIDESVRTSARKPIMMQVSTLNLYRLDILSAAFSFFFLLLRSILYCHYRILV